MLHRFRSPDFRPVATFEEDLDVTTASLAGSTVEATRFAEWREQDLPFHGGRTQKNNAVILEWDEAQTEGAAVPSDSAARYALKQPEEGPAWPLTEEATLVFDLARLRPEGAAPDAIRRGMGLRVGLVDGDSSRVSVPLRRYGTVPPLLRTQHMKLKRLSAPFGDPWEPTLQTYEVPLADLLAQSA